MIQTNGTGALYRLKGEIRVKNWRTYCVFGRKDRVYYVSLLPFVHMFIWYVSDTTYGLQVIGYKKVVEKSAKKVQEHHKQRKRGKSTTKQGAGARTDRKFMQRMHYVLVL
eukprot:675657_1